MMTLPITSCTACGARATLSLLPPAMVWIDKYVKLYVPCRMSQNYHYNKQCALSLFMLHIHVVSLKLFHKIISCAEFTVKYIRTRKTSLTKSK